VKSAHDGFYSCGTFRKCISDFVDDELSGKAKSDFLSHSLICPACDRELKEIKRVKNLLANLAPVTVSSEFDFRLKASLMRENIRFGNPFYRFRLYIRDNLRTLVAVPAMAVVLMGGFLLYSGNPGDRTPGAGFNRTTAVEKKDSPVRAFANAPDEDVYYVLESIDPAEAGFGSIPQNASPAREVSAHAITLISF